MSKQCLKCPNQKYLFQGWLPQVDFVILQGRMNRKAFEFLSTNTSLFLFLCILTCLSEVFVSCLFYSWSRFHPTHWTISHTNPALPCHSTLGFFCNLSSSSLLTFWLSWLVRNVIISPPGHNVNTTAPKSKALTGVFGLDNAMELRYRCSWCRCISAQRLLLPTLRTRIS